MAENDLNIPEEAPKKKKKKHGFLKFLLVLLILAVCFLAYLGGKALYSKYSPYYAEGGMKGLVNGMMNGGEVAAAPTEEPVAEAEVTPAPTPVPQAPAKASSDDGKLSAADVYEQNVASTVAITTHSTINYWGQKIDSGAKGSGFFISDDGYVLTNYHVIEDSDSVSVATYGGDEYKAVIVGYDESNDIAVLKVDSEGKAMPYVTLGDSDKLRVGDEVIAIGNPLGDLTFSMTKGYISALQRPVQLSKTISMELIQTDCAINSGNSGGALFNMNGEVVGITNAKYSSSGFSNEASIEGIGFAIPINTVRDIVSSIIENGYVLKPYIGITVQSISADAADILGVKGGAKVGSVVEGGPAAEAGLKENDIIYTVNGKEITTSDELVEMVSDSAAGDKLLLGVYRDKNPIEIEVTVGSRQQPAITEAASPAETPAPGGAEKTPAQGGSNQGNGYYYNFDFDDANDIYEFFKQWGIPGMG